MKKTSKRETTLVTCSCKDCIKLPIEERVAGFKEDFIRVYYPGLGIRYLYPEHAAVKAYGTGNANVAHKKAAHGICVGVELEGTFPNEEAYGSALCGIYNFEPTRDSSLYTMSPNEIAAEINSPIYRNLCGIQPLFRSLEKTGWKTEDNGSGHHVNISSEGLRVYIIQQAGAEIYKFGCWLRENPDICRACFGRELNHYADAAPGALGKYSFINLEHGNRIEFRLPKYHNARQYFLTINLCIDLYKVLIKFAGTDKQDQICCKLIRHCERFARGEKNYITRQTAKYKNGTK